MGRIRVEWRYGALYGGKLLKGKGGLAVRADALRAGASAHHRGIPRPHLEERMLSLYWSLRIGFALGEPRFVDGSIAGCKQYPP